MSQPEYTLHQHLARAEARALLWRRISLTVVVVFIALAAAHNGNTTYLEAMDAWTAEKLNRVERVARTTRATPAPIWSARCERRGKDAVVKRADSSPWQIHCVPRRVLTAQPA